ncbi:hypothetical protein [Mesorhizobium sp. M7A.F.Ca.MR.245.00.0.0]|uniref:hypothetical protein n=1 Tax=Mesorhizobium sp. M7A.F.Ca.MR.245.00.0.0 TaxID=2496778 RepID=UPI000FCA5B4D|nr:hypothetical protein [Mesorhizobium sp. M7A.F.Ca.MR.245.00.0.0]RUV19963.1 hypothetical protein EOB80_17260 [Mesorhizobium sp. M7A.F.Ca.MR.245.00.0.0]RUV53784.1 hypothetical protein EOB77_00585 [Mesorhizobium sp. M7A.F.Ca.MR.228.00.0.0]
MAGILELLTQDAIGLLSGAFSQQPWGIYFGGVPVIVADNVVEVQYRQQWSISDFPVERGAFESYDKVQIPYDARLRFTAGGSQANRAAMLASIAAVAGDTNLYDVVTPEAVYLSCNFTHYDYSRRANEGMGLLSVDIWLIEVRQAVSAGMSNTQDPSGASQVNGGTVQTAPATSAQLAKFQTSSGLPAGGF